MPNSLAIVIEKLEHYQFVNCEFSLRAHLIDTRTNLPKLGEKLQLKVLLMFEELSNAVAYKEYHPNLIEVTKNEGIRAEDGIADIRLKLKDVSMANDDRRFVICLQAYQSGAGNNLISAQSNAVTCIRHKLVVFEDPNCKSKLLLNDDGQGGYMWYKDEGAKDKCIEMVVQLVDCNNNLVVDRIVPLQVSLTYSSGQLVQPQGVLLLIPERSIFIGSNGYEVVKFRVNEVSRNHRKQNFQIFVAPDIVSSAIAGDISPACSVDFEVKSKRTADARNKTQSTPQYASSEYGMQSSADVAYYSHPSSSDPYVYVKADSVPSYINQSALPIVNSNGMSSMNVVHNNSSEGPDSYHNKRLKVSGGAGGGGMSSISSSNLSDPSGMIPPRYPHDVSALSTSSNSLLNLGPDLAYYPIGVSSVPSSSTANSNNNNHKVSPTLQYSSYPPNMNIPPVSGKYPRMDESFAHSDHRLWNEQCSGYAVEAVREIDAWSKTVLQLMDELLSTQLSQMSVYDAAVKIKMNFATDIVSSIGCLQSYTSYHHQYNCNHTKLLQNLQYQFPTAPVPAAGSYHNSKANFSVPSSYAPVSVSSSSSAANYSNIYNSNPSASDGTSGPNLAPIRSSGLSPTVYSPEEATVQAILVMKSIVVQLHDELDSTTDVGIPAFDANFSLVGFYKSNDNNTMLFRKAAKIEPLLSEMQKSQIKSELVDSIKTKSKFLFDLSSYTTQTDLKSAALAAVMAKAKAEKDLIDAVSLMENLRKPYLG